MSQLDLRAHISAPVDLVYQVVADVEQYPAFLSDVASVDKRGDVVAMTLRMGPLPVRLVTQARFTPSEAIDLTQVEGPFRRFSARWTFTPTDDGTEVGYHADYELPLWNPLLAGPARYLLEHQTQRQIRAFESRVRTLSGPQ
jgi:coenzyme Q-binding protein COQ10